MKAKQLKERRVLQLGELVIGTGADSIDAETLANALLVIAETNDPAFQVPGPVIAAKRTLHITMKETGKITCTSAAVLEQKGLLERDVEDGNRSCRDMSERAERAEATMREQSHELQRARAAAARAEKQGNAEANAELMRLQQELREAKSKVRVTAISPGFVETEFVCFSARSWKRRRRGRTNKAW